MSRYNGVIRPVWAEVDLEAIRHNLSEVRRLVGPAVEIMAVVKAEGYGHGAVETAKTVINAGAGWLGVSLPEEGIALRKTGLDLPILVFGPLQVDQAGIIVKNNLTASVCLLEAAEALSREAKESGKVAQVHVKVDTGMGRVGIGAESAIPFLQELAGLPGIKVTGIFSHLATADEKNKEYALLQIEKFTRLIQELKKRGLLPEKVHLANSAGVIDLPSSYFNMVRPGIMLYGLYPSEEVNRNQVHLKPALSLKARVTFVKKVGPGTGVSYGQKYHTTRETTIATIPIGYADGWSRTLSHKAAVLIAGKRFPVAGMICMDQCMIDVGDEPVRVGDEVVLLGTQGQERIAAEMVAKQLGTINYEVTCMISDRVPRIYRNTNETKTN
jgi:alanine racemase